MTLNYLFNYGYIPAVSRDLFHGHSEAGAVGEASADHAAAQAGRR